MATQAGHVQTASERAVPGATGKDWRKFVTVDPPASISFMLYPEDSRPFTWVTLINKSDQEILFKVKTTKPMSYLVRPSQGIIQSNSNIKVQVLFNHKLDSEVSFNHLNDTVTLMVQEENQAIATDKFLVQLAPVPFGADLS